MPDIDKVECFICGEDITKGIKVLSYNNFPDKVWDKAIQDWAKNYRELFNGAMCQKCAKKDLDVAHFKANKKHLVGEIEEEYEQKIFRYKEELKRFYNLFGRFYIKI